MFGFGRKQKAGQPVTSCSIAPGTTPPSWGNGSAAHQPGNGHPDLKVVSPPPGDSRNFTFIPKNGRVAVERMDAERITRGGIVLPEASQEKNCLVRVLAVCPKWHEDGIERHSDYDQGDLLLISKYAGEEHVLDHGTLKIVSVREADVLAHIQVKGTATRMPNAMLVPSELPGTVLEVEGADREQHNGIPNYPFEKL